MPKKTDRSREDAIGQDGAGRSAPSRIHNQSAFTFAELMIRWGCSENRIRELVVAGELVPSYFVDGPVQPVYELPRSNCTLPTYAGHGEEPHFHLHEMLYLVRPFDAGPLDCSFAYLSRNRLPPGTPSELGQTDAVEDSTAWEAATEAHPARLKTARPIVAYCMLHEERSLVKGPPTVVSLGDVVERGFFLHTEVALAEGHTQEVSGPNPQPAQQEVVTPALLGALIEMLVSGKRVSAFNKQDALTQHLIDKFQGVRGFSKRTIDGAFASANRAFRERLDDRDQ